MVDLPETFPDTVPDVSGYVVFCDDIRHEANGKMILIGAYLGGLRAPDFPIQVRSFGALIHYFERIGTETEPVTIRLYMPGDDDTAAAQFVIPQDWRAQPSFPDTDFIPRFHTVYVPIVIGPLVLKQKGYVRVLATVGDRTIRLGVLRVERAPQPAEFPTPSQNEVAPPTP